MECSNNLKNLSLAASNFAAAHNGTLPYLHSNAAGGRIRNHPEEDFGWPLFLFPHLDLAEGVEYMENGGSAPVLVDLVYKVFTCPDDTGNFRRKAGLSYAANMGYGRFQTPIGHSPADYPNWDAPDSLTLDATDIEVERATGVFWAPHEDGWRSSLDKIADGGGGGQTLLFTETVNAGGIRIYDQSAHRADTYAAMECGVGVDAERDLGLPAGRGPAGPLDFSRNVSAATFMGFSAINANLQTRPGLAPSASSNHPGVVNIGFCDGSVRTVNDRISKAIQALMYTPFGVRYGQQAIGDAF